MFQHFFENSVLIDFNSLGYKYKDHFLGYVDLSKAGDFTEALFNLYNVFHQINKIDATKIYVYNFKFIDDELNTTLWDRLNMASNNKEIALPISLLNL